MFRWADHVDVDHIARVRDALDALPDQITQIKGYVHGADVGVAEGNFDYVVVADFERVDDWRTYRDHPAHLLFVEELVKGHVANRAAVQYQTPAHRSAHDVPTDDVGDEELMERARRAAIADMARLLAEPDDVT
jgi:Stress responsive A/B Barrel Domain